MASGLCLLLEVDWASLLKSFYEKVRLKIACRNPLNIPKERLYKMNKKLYMVSTTMKGHE
jgi:hypothetical protein